MPPSPGAAGGSQTRNDVNDDEDFYDPKGKPGDGTGASRTCSPQNASQRFRSSEPGPPLPPEDESVLERSHGSAAPLSPVARMSGPRPPLPAEDAAGVEPPSAHAGLPPPPPGKPPRFSTTSPGPSLSVDTDLFEETLHSNASADTESGASANGRSPGKRRPFSLASLAASQNAVAPVKGLPKPPSPSAKSKRAVISTNSEVFAKPDGVPPPPPPPMPKGVASSPMAASGASLSAWRSP